MSGPQITQTVVIRLFDSLNCNGQLSNRSGGEGGGGWRLLHYFLDFWERRLILKKRENT